MKLNINGQSKDADVIEMPKVEVHLIKSGEAPGGGEPGTPSIATAITNALFKLTGKRIHSLPNKI